MKTKYIALAVSLLIGIGAFAQHNEEVTIEGAYRPKVNKVDKILMQPEKPQQSFQMPNATTKVLDIDHRFPLELEKLSALGYNGKNGQTPEPTKNFLMAGIGSRISPLFLYKHNSNLTKNLGLGVGIKHYSSWLDIKDYAPSSFMNNAFEIGLTSGNNKNVQLGGNVYYKNDMVHYYGVNLEETPLTDAQIETSCPRQVYNTIGGHFDLASTSTRLGEVSHNGSVDYHYAFDKFGSQEHFLDVNYGLGYAQSWWGDKSHPQKLGFSFGAQYDGFAPAGAIESRILFDVNPFFEVKGEFYRLHLGARVDGVYGEELNDPFFAVHPDLSGSLFVLNKKLEFYAGLNGGRHLVTFREAFEGNPFVLIHSQGEIQAVKNEKLCFEGGVRTNIAEVVDLHLGVRYRHTDNDWFYQQRRDASYEGSNLPYNCFGLVYDETRTVSVLADMRLKLRGGFSADLGFAYNNYKMTKEECPWYRPAMEGKLKLNYDVNDNLAFNVSFLYQGGRYAKVWNNGPYWTAKYPLIYDVVQLKDVFDLSLGADYHFSDQLSVFVKLDNVLNQKYQLYYNYPVTGFQAFAGLKMSF